MSHARYPRSLSFLISILFIALLTPRGHAVGVQFVRPGAGGAYPAGQFVVNWTDAGGTPDMAQLTTYSLQLIAGGNNAADSVVLATLSPPGAQVADGSLVTEVPADVSASIQNGFYLSMISNTTLGGQVINYSSRFTLISLNGTLAETYIAGAQAAPGASNVPGPQWNREALATSSSISPSATPTAASVSTPAAASTATAAGTHVISSAELAGLAVGSLAAVVLLVVLVALLVYFWRKGRRERQRQAALEAQEMDEVFGLDDARRRRRQTPLAEMSAEHMRVEAMDAEKACEAASEERYELEGDWGGWEAAAGRASRAYDPTR